MFGIRAHHNGETFDVYNDGVKVASGYPSVMAVAKDWGIRAICNGTDSMKDGDWIEKDVMAVSRFFTTINPSDDELRGTSQRDDNPLGLQFGFDGATFMVTRHGDRIDADIPNLSKLADQYGYNILSNPNASVQRHPALMKRLCEIIDERCTPIAHTNHAAQRALDAAMGWQTICADVPAAALV